MKITNKYGLPETIMAFANRDNYNAGKSDITVTQLIDSPRVVMLRRKHNHELEQDVSEMLWALMGTAMHHVLESQDAANHVNEERLFVKLNGWMISGQIDSQEIYDDGVIVGDYKFTSAWAVMNEKPDWEKQLNSYAFLVRKAKGLKVKGLKIHAFIRDWNRRDVGKEGYPVVPLVSINIPVWSDAEQDYYMESRLHLHGEADVTMNFGGDLIQCDPEERWQRGESFAVMNEKNMKGRAKRVFEIKEEAEAYIKENKGTCLVVRPAAPIRCVNNYCRVAAFCDQFKQEQA
jgi:hypothetical protein